MACRLAWTLSGLADPLPALVTGVSCKKPRKVNSVVDLPAPLPPSNLKLRPAKRGKDCPQHLPPPRSYEVSAEEED